MRTETANDSGKVVKISVGAEKCGYRVIVLYLDGFSTVDRLINFYFFRNSRGFMSIPFGYEELLSFV